MPEREQPYRTEQTRFIRNMMQRTAQILGNRADEDISISSGLTEFAINLGLAGVSPDYIERFLQILYRKVDLGSESTQSGYYEFWNVLEALLLFDRDDEEPLLRTEREFMLERLRLGSGSEMDMQAAHEYACGFQDRFYSANPEDDVEIVLYDLAEDLQFEDWEVDFTGIDLTDYNAGVLHALADAQVLAVRLP
jgi:hypothetical protein